MSQLVNQHTLASQHIASRPAPTHTHMHTQYLESLEVTGCSSQKPEFFSLKFWCNLAQQCVQTPKYHSRAKFSKMLLSAQSHLYSPTSIFTHNCIRPHHLYSPQDPTIYLTQHPPRKTECCTQLRAICSMISCIVNQNFVLINKAFHGKVQTPFLQ